MKSKEKLLKIFDNYGLEHQMRKFNEETFELKQAILDNEWQKIIGLQNIDHITEEIADVQVLLEQFKAHYNINEEDIEKIMNFKIERQLKRIEDENCQQS